MQHYIHVGFGVPGAQLLPQEADRVWHAHDGTDEAGLEQKQLRFVPFTEDYEGAEWGTLVLHDFGEVPGYAGKLITRRGAESLLEKYQLTPERRGRFLQLLATQGLERLADHVDLVFFSHNY